MRQLRELEMDLPPDGVFVKGRGRLREDGAGGAEEGDRVHEPY
jgi:hypothetical protein